MGKGCHASLLFKGGRAFLPAVAARNGRVPVAPIEWPAFAWPFLIPIDHVLHSGEIRILHKDVGRDVGSDHYPVIVDFTLH